MVKLIAYKSDISIDKISTEHGQQITRVRKHFAPNSTTTSVLEAHTCARTDAVICHSILPLDIDISLEEKTGRCGQIWQGPRTMGHLFLVRCWCIRTGLAGLEANMLDKPFWKPSNAASLLMHSDNSWSGPGGWSKGLKAVPVMFKKRGRYVHRLWLLLAFFSFLLFLALSISGLCLELSDGYTSSNSRVMVVGRTRENFNNKDYRNPSPYTEGAWAVGSAPALPGFGIIYTPDAFDCSQFEGLNCVPNTMPLAGGAVDIFLAPQSQSPVVGRAWSLRAN